MGVYYLKEADDPEISVVVPTLPSNTLQSRSALHCQDGVDYEVIVVERADLDICEARNHGIELARSPYVALTDDDTEPPTDWILTALRHVRRDDVHLIEGPVKGENKPERVYPGCNIAFSKSAWESVDGFNSRYAGWMDDTVFGWDIEATFGKSATSYVPEMEMVHNGPMRSAVILENERRAREEYFDQYFEVFRNPNSLKGKMFILIAKKSHSFAPNLVNRTFAYVDG